MSDDAQESAWHPEAITSSTEQTLHDLSISSLGDFYLAGGTGLALQFGHRISEDLDFFKMLRGEFRQFSVERLLRFLVALDQDVEIVVKPHRDTKNAPALHVS
jgi:hypothetical protein